MPCSGPQPFDLKVYDNYQTNDPSAPLSGVDVAATTTVTVNWNAAGTDLTNKGVQFADPQWDAPGCGPLSVYADVIGGGMQKTGTVAWSVVTHVLQRMEVDTPGNRQRLAVTPVIQLLRTFTAIEGNSPEELVAFTASETVRGNWMPRS